MLKDIFNPRTQWLLALAALGVAIACLYIKPYWRDEIYSLYFSDPSLRIGSTLEERLTREVHPPLYYWLMNPWRAFDLGVTWARWFNVACLVVGGALAWVLGRDRPRETALFLVLMVSSFWATFFITEARQYVLAFVLAGLCVLTLRRAFDSPRPLLWAPVWLIFCTLTMLSLYFAALYVGMLGGFGAIALFFRKSKAAGVAFLAATALACIPTALWVLRALPMNEATGLIIAHKPFATEWWPATEQVLRGLIIKTGLSNLAVTVAAFLVIRQAPVERRALLWAIFAATMATILGAYAIHFGMGPWIKERGFMPMMAGIFFTFACLLAAAKFETKAQKFWIAAAPAFGLFTLAAGLPETTKDREDLRELRPVLTAALTPCQGSELIVWDQDDRPNFGVYYAQRLFASVARREDHGLILRDAATLSPSSPPAWKPECPLRAIALAVGQTRGERRAVVRGDLAGVGLNLDLLSETVFGGRHFLYRQIDTASRREETGS